MRASFKPSIIKVLGSIGYVAIVFQWLQIGIVWLPRFIDSKLGRIIFPQSHTTVPPTNPPVSASGAAAGPDFVTTFLVSAVALIVVGYVAYVVIIRYTRAINKSGSQVTHAIAKTAIHIIAHKPLEQLSQKKRIVLSRRLLFWTKVTFALLPLALLPLALHAGMRGIVEQLALFVQAVLATIAVGSFFIQALLAVRWHERADDIN